MGDRSFLADAWDRTELRGFKKIYTTVIAGLLTLAWNYRLGLRTLQTTEWFAICVVASWLSLTGLEFLGHLSAIWIRGKWNTFLQQVKTEIVHEIATTVRTSPKASKQRYIAPYPDGAATLRLIEDLKQIRGMVRILSAAGDHESYRYAEFLVDTFAKAGCEANHEPSPIGADYFGLVLGLHDRRELSDQASLVSHALGRAGINFSIRDFMAYPGWCLMVGRSI